MKVQHVVVELLYIHAFLASGDAQGKLYVTLLAVDGVEAYSIPPTTPPLHCNSQVYRYLYVVSADLFGINQQWRSLE
eukprot:m.1642903 g.1642903  ORF g.1642903 m.1642903 type:complete len:77 (-) comp55793_c0_seq1:56-286(-)